MFSAMFFAGTSSVFAQDDVYYSPDKDKGKSGYNNANYEDQFNRKPSVNPSPVSNSSNGSTSSPNNFDDRSGSSNSSNNTDGYENTRATNNNSYYNDNDFSYTSRLRRYYTPSFGVNFWDPWYTDAFFYTRDPWMWGNSIYVNAIPSWNWWRPRNVIVYDPWGSWNGFNNGNAWNSPWYGNGWNNCGWNSWGNGFGNGWNNFQGGNFYGGGGGNYWGYNNGFWNGNNNGFNNGFNNGNNNGAWNNGGGSGGRNYGMSGPRFQSSGTNNSGSNSLPRKSGKTDETNVPREGIVKPRNSPDTYTPPRDAPKPEGGMKDRSGTLEPATPSDKFTGKKVPVDGWKAAPVEERGVPARIQDGNISLDRLNQKPIQNENTPVEKSNRDWNNTPIEQPRRFDNVPVEKVQPPTEQPRRYDNVTPAERPNGGRIDRMRDEFNRDMQPVERPSRTIEQPQRVQPREEIRVQPEQRDYEPPQREIRQQQQRPQREIQRSEPQRIERQTPQRQMQQPQRQFQPQREAPRMEQMNRPQPSQRQMSPGRRP